MLDEPGAYKADNVDVLCRDGEKLISIPMVHKDKAIIRWNVATFHTADRDLMKAMLTAFPEHKATLKKIALDDALGL